MINDEINYDLIKEMFKKQNEFNEYTIKNWKKANLNWRRAIWLECAEAVESTDWKWWKKSPTDEENLKVELVDIWHFIMSYIMVHKKAIAERPKDYNYLFMKADEKKVKNLKINDMFEDLVKLTLEDENPDHKFIIFIFMNIWYKLGYNINDLYKNYMIKNCLNVFRQDNGYKDGTYIKMWTKSDGKKYEDNVIAWDISDTLNLDVNFFNNLYKKLNDFYKNMKKN